MMPVGFLFSLGFRLATDTARDLDWDSLSSTIDESVTSIELSGSTDLLPPLVDALTVAWGLASASE